MQGDAFKEKLIGWSSDKPVGSHLPSSPLPSPFLLYSPSSGRTSESSTKPHAKNESLMQSKRRRAGNCGVTAVFLASLRMQTKAAHERK